MKAVQTIAPVTLLVLLVITALGIVVFRGLSLLDHSD